MCGMNAREAQWYSRISILQYTSLKMTFLLHKTALANFPMATTVFGCKDSLQILVYQPEQSAVSCTTIEHFQKNSYTL